MTRRIGYLTLWYEVFTYTNGKDTPDEALMDDAYDAKKNLVNIEKEQTDGKQKRKQDDT